MEHITTDAVKRAVPGFSDELIRVWFSAADSHIIGSWQLLEQGVGSYPVLRHIGGSDTVLFTLDKLLPRTGGYIKSFTLLLEGGTGHTDLPGSMPTVELLSAGSGVGGSGFPTPSVLASVTDSSPDKDAYELVHAVTLPLASIAINSAARYFLRLRGETGANAISNQLHCAGGYVELAGK